MAPPPTRLEMLNALDKYPELDDPWEARVLLLRDNWTAQTGNLLNCNRGKAALRGWYDDQLKKLEERQLED